MTIGADRMTPGDPYYINPRERRRLRYRMGAGVLAVMGLVSFSLAFIETLLFLTTPSDHATRAAAPRLITPSPSTTGQGYRNQVPVAPLPLVLPAEPSLPADWD